MAEPDKAGRYWARSVSYDMLNQRILSATYMVDVVADVPNPRDHKLLVKTGHDHPKFRSLNCYEFGEPTAREAEFLRQLANQR